MAAGCSVLAALTDEHEQRSSLRSRAAELGTILLEHDYSATMEDPSKRDRMRRRTEKLQREAANCLTLAVTEHSTDFAADLIEEASMLMRRVNELYEA